MMPTPTPLPPPEEVALQMPDISLWDMAPDAIQTWNSASTITVTFQAVVLVGLILFIMMALFNYAKVITVVRND